MKADKSDIYQKITDSIVSAIEDGTAEFKMPWKSADSGLRIPTNAATHLPYRGINILALWAIAYEKGFGSQIWATYKQWQDIGAQVRKGEKSAPVVFWNSVDRKAESRGGEKETEAKRISFAVEYSVFNADQVDGYKLSEPVEVVSEPRIETAELFFRTVGIVPKQGGSRAFYSPASDSIHMPPFHAFPNPLFYYSVLSHEATHWTGPKHRLDRDLSGRFGSESYAMEELVAELGSAFLCAELNLPTDPRTDHAPYIDSWLSVLKQDKRAIFTAASKAQQAVEYFAGLIASAASNN